MADETPLPAESIVACDDHVVDAVRRVVLAAAAEAGLTADDRNRVDVVIEEAVTNVAVHTDRGVGGPLAVRVWTDGPGRLRVELRDTGPPFDPLREAPAPVLAAPIEARPIGGLGVHLIRAMSDHVAYRRDREANVLDLTFITRVPSRDRE